MNRIDVHKYDTLDAAVAFFCAQRKSINFPADSFVETLKQAWGSRCSAAMSGGHSWQ